MEKIKLGIVEDNEEILNSLTTYFDSQKVIEIAITGKNVEDFIKSSRDTEVDVVLLDIMLDGKNGIDGIPSIKQKWPNANIIMNSVLDDHEHIFKALQQGAVGYLTKETSLENIKTSIIQSSKGMSIMNSSIANRIIKFFSEPNNNVKEKLTEKEMMVAEALKNGLSYKLIAIEYGLSLDTIRFHVRNIYKKLQINSKGELIHLMMKR